VEHRLLAAFQSPLLGWLTIAFLFTTSADTYIKRIDQHKNTGVLPKEILPVPAWVWLLFYVTDNLLKLAILVLNWQYGLLICIIGLALATLGISEKVGSILMYPFIRIRLPDNFPRSSSYDVSSPMRSIMIDMEKSAFVFGMLLAVAAYIAIVLLLKAVLKDAAIEFAWLLQLSRIALYICIFWLAWNRANECAYQATWLVWILGIAGRINDFEAIVMPIVVVGALIISAKHTVAELPTDVNIV